MLLKKAAHKNLHITTNNINIKSNKKIKITPLSKVYIVQESVR